MKLSHPGPMMVGPTLEMEEHMDGSMQKARQRDPEQLERLERLLADRRLEQRGGELQGLLTELDGALDDLQVILGPALRPAGPERALHEVDPEPLTELAALLQSLAGRLNRAVMFARDLADRVDL